MRLNRHSNGKRPRSLITSRLFIAVAAIAVIAAAVALTTLALIPGGDDAVAVSDDTYTAEPGATLNVPAPGVLSNDLDSAEGDLAVTSNTPASNGSLSVSPDGSFTYTPGPEFNGSDSFTYEASDNNGDKATAIVTITVGPTSATPAGSPTITGSPAEGVADYDVILTVDADNEIEPFSDRMRGVATNSWNWLWEGLWDRPDTPPGKHEAIVDATARLEPGIIRFAGALWANEVGWDRNNQRDGIDDGPWTWTDPESGQDFHYRHAYSPEMIDAFHEFSAQVGPDGGTAQAIIQVNVCDNNIPMWQDMVRYANVERGYGFEYWEIGNEQSFEDCGLNPASYAERFARYQEAMKAVDPSIKLMGPISQQPTFTDWDDALVERLGTELDVLAWHWYQVTEWGAAPSEFEFQGGSIEGFLAWGGNVGTAEWDGFGTPDGDVNSIPDGDLDRWTYRRGMAQQRMDAVRERYIEPGLVDPDIETALTELNPYSSEHDHPINGGHLAAVWLADTLPRWAYHGLDIVTYYSLEDGGVGPEVNNARGLFGSDDDTRLDIRPTYHMAWLFARHFGDTLVESSTSDPERKVVAWASSDSADGRLKLILVNLTDRESEAGLRISGFSPATGEAYVLTSEDPVGKGNELTVEDTAYFNEHTTSINGVTVPDYEIADPSAFTNALDEIEASPVAFDASREFSYTLPAYSVTVLELSE